MLKRFRIAFDLFRFALPTRFSHLALVIATLATAPGVRAVEVLTVQELVAHCKHIEPEPEGADSQYCIRYIQGFIDGAVATDVRVMINLETESQEGESFSQRAMRTRLPSRLDEERAARLAGFCLGDPLPLRGVVDLVVADLVRLDPGKMPDSPAREAVYESLVKHYPCAGE